jgi:hypothetical protein
MKTKKVLMAFGVFAAICSTACAADAALPTVTKAFDLFDSYPQSVPPGTLVVFRKKDTILASRIADAGIQARIFTLGELDLTPHAMSTDDGCGLYMSTVYPLTRSGNNDLILHKVSERWLRPSDSRKSIKAGRYYIVFEKLMPTNSQFRLRISDTPAYFGSGFMLLVEDDGTANLQTVIDEYKKREGNLEVLRLEVNDPTRKFPCYKYTKYADGTQTQDENTHTLALCTPESAINIDMSHS